MTRGRNRDFGFSRTCLSRRDRRVSMAGRRFRSCGSPFNGWIPQAVDPVEDAGEHHARQCRLGQLEDGIAGVAHKPGTGLDQPLTQRGQRPGVDPLRRRQRAQEVGEVAGKGMEVQPGLGSQRNAYKTSASTSARACPP